MTFMKNFKKVSVFSTLLVQLNLCKALTAPYFSDRAFSTNIPSPAKVYENAQLLKKIILRENKDKAGVYL